MIKKLKAIGIIIGLISPMCDLIRALGALSVEKTRILAELLDRFRQDIEAELAEEPSLQGVKEALLAVQAKLTEAASSGAFKLFLLCVLCASAVNSPAQVQFSLPTDIVAAGANYNQYAAPQISGLLVYAHQIAPGTYSFSAVDLTSKSVRPFILQTATTTGVARHVRDVGSARVFAIGTAGMAAGGENLGGAFSAGGAAVFPLRGGWCAMVTARILETSIAERQYAVGLAIGWGK
jgi:hypothetical protein